MMPSTGWQCWMMLLFDAGALSDRVPTSRPEGQTPAVCRLLPRQLPAELRVSRDMYSDVGF